MKFKVGDSVKILVGGPYNLPGDRGTVMEDDDCPFVSVSNAPKGRWSFQQCDLSLWDNSPKEEKKLGSNPKDSQGIKKVQLNLVPASSVIYQALAMENGAAKYGAYNWRSNKVIASIYIAAAMRHISEWYDSGVELADDSKIPHLAHALACLGIIVDAKETGNLIDDRPTPGATQALLKKWEKKDNKSFDADTGTNKPEPSGSKE